MQENPLVGTWLLRSAELRSAHEMTHPWGPDATGQLIHSADGYMSVIITAARRPQFATSDLRGGGNEELAQAARTCTAYAGRYERCGDTVVHHVEASLFPNWVGTDQVRRFDFVGGQVRLRTPPTVIRDRDNASRH